MHQILVTPSPPSLLDRLRNETRTEHEAIEAVVEARDPFASTARYRALLEASLGFYEPVERALVSFAGREKVPALLRDLRFLGATPQRIAALPRIPWTPDASRAALFGCAYVLEGATLGGRVLSRRAKEKLGLGPDCGAAFFAGYGDETGEMWGRFRGSLLRELTDADGDRLVASARETFSAYRTWLSQP